MSVEVNCPCCNSTNFVEIEDYQDGSTVIECSHCGISMEVSYSSSLEVEDVTLVEIPSIEFYCPKCGYSMTLESVETENGSEEIGCDGCGALLGVSWNECGQDVNVEVLEEGEDEEEHDEEDVDDYDEEEYL
jgi:transcription elongation factor Elf1